MLDLWFVYAIPFVFFIIFLTKWFFTAPTHKNSPPSPPALPIVGNLHQVGLYPHRTLQKLAHQYGPLMLLHFGSKPVLIVSSPDGAREIMKTHDLIFLNRPKSSVTHRILYHNRNLTTSPYGEYWRQLRSICTLQLLSNTRVQSFRAIREEEVTLLVDNIKQSCSRSSSSSPSPVNLSDMFGLLTNDVICRVVFRKKYSGDEKGKRFRELINELMELLDGFHVGEFIPWLAWVDRLNGFDAQVDRVAKEFDEFVEAVVEEHVNAFNIKDKKYDDQDGEDKKDFVDVLLEIQSDEVAGYSLDRESIKATVLDMFIAGTDTTYTVLEWAMAELLRHPRVMKKLQDEVRESGKGKAYITENDLEKMHYLKAVIKETLRLYPPVPLLVPRESTQDVNINGYDIAAGTTVITNAWAIGRDPKLWDKPEEFLPERFLDSGIDFRGQNFELIPFGAGRRGCPGTLFAKATDEVSLANVVYKFDWSLPDGVTAQDLDMTECTGATIHRKVPLLAVATPRSC